MDRLRHERAWIVDPLDGTQEFLPQNGEFAVMIGLAGRGTPVLGVVYLPALDLLFRAAAGACAWREEGDRRERLACATRFPGAPRLVGSRSQAEPLLDEIRGLLGVSEVSVCGSVGVKCARIAQGRQDLYVHPVPYLKEWDTCAPEVIIREAGGFVSDCIGEPLLYNKPNPLQLHGLLVRAPACDATLLSPILALYADRNGNRARRSVHEKASP